MSFSLYNFVHLSKNADYGIILSTQGFQEGVSWKSLVQKEPKWLPERHYWRSDFYYKSSMYKVQSAIIVNGFSMI